MTAITPSTGNILQEREENSFSSSLEILELLRQVDPEGAFLTDQDQEKGPSFLREVIEIPQGLSSFPQWKEVVERCQSPIPHEEKQEAILTFLEGLLNIPDPKPSMTLADRLIRIRESASRQDMESKQSKERGERTQEAWAAAEASRERKAAKKRIRRLIKGLPPSPAKEAFLTSLKEERGSHLAELQLLFMMLGELMLEYGIIKKSLEESAQQQWKEWVDKKVAELQEKASDTRKSANQILLYPSLAALPSMLAHTNLWEGNTKTFWEKGYGKLNLAESVGKFLGHWNTMRDTKHSAREEAFEYGKQFAQGERQAMEKQHDNTTQTEERLFQLCLEIASQYKQLCDQANR